VGISKDFNSFDIPSLHFHWREELINLVPPRGQVSDIQTFGTGYLKCLIPWGTSRFAEYCWRDPTFFFDILTYFFLDPQIVPEQFLAFPLILGEPSLRRVENLFTEKFKYFVLIFFNPLFSS
jgi:hypothetical protein